MSRYPADRNPMSSARRQHVHGPLQGIAEPMDRFTLAICAFMSGLTAGTIAFACGVLS